MGVEEKILFDEEIFETNLEKGLQNKLPLKNDNERKAFLNTYKKWPIIAQINELCLRIHKFQLRNNVSILAFEVCDTKYEMVSYQIFSRRKDITINYSSLGNFRLWFDSVPQVIKFLKDRKDEI